MRESTFSCVELVKRLVKRRHGLIAALAKLPIDSRYAKIVEVMRASEQQRPRLRRRGDQLGAFYTPLAIVIALGAWAVSGNALRMALPAGRLSNF